MRTNKKKPKGVVLKVNKKIFKTENNKELTKAAKKRFKSIDRHFKVDGWDLDLGFQITEVFYEAYGEHLETYLLKELFSNHKKGYYITVNKEHRTVIRKSKNV